MEVAFNANPVLVNTKRILDQSGAKALLINNLPMQNTLALLITAPSRAIPEAMLTSEEVLAELVDTVELGRCEDRVFVRMGEVSAWEREYFPDMEETVKLEEEDTLDGLWRHMQGLTTTRKRGNDGRSLETSKEGLGLPLCTEMEEEVEPIDIDAKSEKPPEESVVVGEDGNPVKPDTEARPTLLDKEHEEMSIVIGADGNPVPGTPLPQEELPSKPAELNTG